MKIYYWLFIPLVLEFIVPFIANKVFSSGEKLQYTGRVAVERSILYLRVNVFMGLFVSAWFGALSMFFLSRQETGLLVGSCCALVFCAAGWLLSLDALSRERRRLRIYYGGE